MNKKSKNCHSFLGGDGGISILILIVTNVEVTIKVECFRKKLFSQAVHSLFNVGVGTEFQQDL